MRIYILSLYFVIQTITTVGYGDSNPLNTKERLFQIAAMLIGVIAFSFIAGSLSSMITTFDIVMGEKKRNNERLTMLNAVYKFGDDL